MIVSMRTITKYYKYKIYFCRPLFKITQMNSCTKIGKQISHVRVYSLTAIF